MYGLERTISFGTTLCESEKKQQLLWAEGNNKQSEKQNKCNSAVWIQ